MLLITEICTLIFFLKKNTEVCISYDIEINDPIVIILNY